VVAADVPVRPEIRWQVDPDDFVRDATLPEYVGFAQGFGATVIAIAVSRASRLVDARRWLMLVDSTMVAR
jgi:hypothetical protein